MTVCSQHDAEKDWEKKHDAEGWVYRQSNPMMYKEFTLALGNLRPSVKKCVFSTLCVAQGIRSAP